MIPIVEESPRHFKEFGVYERCFFNCGKTSKYWYWRTNQPVCKDCAKVHKVHELKKAHPKYSPRTKVQFTKDN